MKNLARFWEWLTANWKVVGTFEGHVSHEDNGAPYTYYYVLLERAGDRKVKRIDGLFKRTSRHSHWAEAQVQQWLYGGPLPTGVVAQKEPEHRPKAELIVFPGGKKS